MLYIGSASKRLAPGLRLAWMLLPSWLTWPLVSAKSIEDSGSEVLGQMALADFIARGELDRHLRRMRLLYTQRRQTLLTELARRLPALRPHGEPAGVFELLSLPSSIDEASLLETAARSGVGLDGLSLHRAADRGPPGIVVGYAGMSEAALVQAVERLADAFTAVG
jgi:GntR family transcriptional regulator/MocR family aminotransferase